jgi:hypothetical protein
MFTYRRTTRECSVNQLNPKLLTAIQDYFSEHKFGDLVEETRLCIETFSEKENPGSMDTFLSGNPDSSDYLGLILTEQWLLWARAGDRSGTKVFGASLMDLKVKSYRSRFSNESGLHIKGYLCDFKDRVAGNLALGPEEAARKFCEEAGKAVEKVAPPPKKGIIPWLDWPKR